MKRLTDQELTRIQSCSAFGSPLAARAIRELIELRAAVKKVVTQRADDLCWRDVYSELSELVNIDFVPKMIEPSEAFLANCKAFDCSLRTGGPYKPVYVEKAESP